jgi:aryl-alcohol dehydrogenase-like predicted oxidoreductase
MQRRQLAASGFTVSRIGLGTATWGATTDRDDAARQLAQFVGAGGDLLDTADIYAFGRSEEMIGQLLGRVVPRSSIVLATKAGAVAPRRIDASRAHLLAALDTSLRRLRTDYVDLWQLHGWDTASPIEETLGAMQTALSSGRARYAGVCNFAGWQLTKAAASRRRAPLVSCQMEYSLLERGIERELVPAVLDAGLGVLPWAPLGRGVLTGKYRSGVPAEKVTSKFFNRYVRPHVDAARTPSILAALAAVSAEVGAAPLAVSLAWVRDRPAVVAPIVGARTADQLPESLRAERLELPEEARRRLDEVSAPYTGYPERILF